MNANEAMNAAFRRAAGHGPNTQDAPSVPGENASDAELAAWVEYVRNRPKQGIGSADGGAHSDAPKLSGSQIMSRLIRRAAGWER